MLNLGTIRKLKRNQEKKQRSEFRKKLVAEGKKVIFDPKEGKIKIVEVQKPYRKKDAQ